MYVMQHFKRKIEKLIKNFLRSSCDRFEAQPVQGKPALFFLRITAWWLQQVGWKGGGQTRLKNASRC